MTKKYDFVINLQADTTHTRIIRMVGHSKRVLEFGCATGYMSRVLVEQFGCTVTGIELNPDAAEEARKACRKVIVGDADTLDYARELAGENFDVVIFADVLEHLKDPGSVLKRVRDFIRPEGYVLASIPNIAHAAVVLELLKGNFDYRPLGLLDDTHLRFFTKKTIYGLVESSGYVIDQFDRVNIEPEATEFGIRTAEYAPEVVKFSMQHAESTTYQFIIRAYPATESGRIIQLKQRMDKLEAALAEKDTRLSHLEALRGSLEAALAEKDTRLGHLEALRGSLEAALAEKDTRLSHLEALRGSLEAALAEKDTRLGHLEALRGSLEAALAEKDTRLGHLEASVEARDASIGDLSEALTQKTQEVTHLQATAQDQEETLKQKEAEISRLDTARHRAAEELQEKTSILNRVYDSHGWKALSAYYNLRNTLLPEGSWRKNLSKRILHSIPKLRKRIPKQAQLNPTASATSSAPEEEAPEAGYHLEQVTSNTQNVSAQDSRLLASEFAATSIVGHEPKWEDHEILSQRITALRQSRLERLSLKPSVMVSIKESELSAHAASLQFQAEEQVEVSIVISVSNNLKRTLECLTSVMKHPAGVAYEIVVVDDDSSDQTSDILQRLTNIAYIRNEKRLGFTLSCNRGAQGARGEYVLFLDSDVQVTENWLKPLVETFENHRNVGAVGPKILLPDGHLWEAGALVNRDGTSRSIGLFDDPDLPRFNYSREVMSCSSACLLVDAKILKDLGGFDTSLAPGYCEDWDLGFRLRERGSRVMYNPTSVVIRHPSATSCNRNEGSDITHAISSQQALCESWQREIDNLNRIRLIALYVPQYHPIPEKDHRWGKGLIEWTNVAGARPNFIGHYQPHLPADLGFCDLRVEETVQQQAQLAKRYGIYGFCFLYDGFAGRRSLAAPLESILRGKEPVIPFCIAWANANWTEGCDGQEDGTRIAQQHSEDDRHVAIRDMMRYLHHPNYIRVNGRPLLIMCDVNLFPNINRATEIWRDFCRAEGIGEIYLTMAEPFGHSIVWEHPAKYGFDASMEYPPHGMNAPIKPPGQILNPDFRGVIHDYAQVILNSLQREIPGHVRFRTVMPSWDNTPRRQNDTVIFENTRPEAYQAWLEAILDQTHEQNFGDERIVFINAWNEWRDGSHLEPDRRYGHGFLEATRNAQDVCLLRREKPISLE